MSPVYMKIIATINFSIPHSFFPMKNISKVFSYLLFQLPPYSLFPLVESKVLLIRRNQFKDSYTRVFTFFVVHQTVKKNTKSGQHKQTNVFLHRYFSFKIMYSAIIMVFQKPTLTSETIFGNRKHFKHDEKCFLIRLFSFSRYLRFCLDILVLYKNSLIRNIMLVLKFMTSQPG